MHDPAVDGEERRAQGRAPDHGLPLLLLLVLIGAGVLARGIEASRKSLWIDELHSIDHADQPSPAAVLEHLKEDFHAPLFFLALHPLRAVDGHALRWVAIVGSLLVLLPLLAMAAEAGVGRTGRAVLALAVALLPFQILFGTELRPYPWLQLATAVAAWAAFTARGPRLTRVLALGAATACGLYLHYLMAVALAGLVLARLVVRRREILPLRHALAAILAGGVAFLPWVIADEGWIFSDPGVLRRDERPDRDGAPRPAPAPKAEERPATARLAVAARELPRLVTPMAGSLGTASDRAIRPATVAILAVLVLAVLAAVVAAARGRGDRGPPSAAVRGPLLAACLTAAILFVVSGLSGFGIRIQYFVAAGWLLPLSLGVALGRARPGRFRRLLVLVLAVACACAAAAHVLGRSREDLREGVRRAIALAGRDALFTARLSQPRFFSSLTVFDQYAPGVEAVEAAAVPPARDLAPGRRVAVVSRKIPYRQGAASDDAWRAIAAGRRLVEEAPIDGAITVYVFAPE